VRCQECLREAAGNAVGWRAYPTDTLFAEDLDTDEAPYVVFYCPVCAEREFGPLLPRQRSSER
jgi:hypothetical protein